MTLLRFTSRNLITDRWLKDHPDEKIECWACGKLIDKDDPRRKYCDNKCKKRYWNALHRTINYHYCLWCSKEFEATRSDKQFCSKRCLQSAGRKRRGIPVLSEMVRTCRNCRTRFTPKHNAQFYCSFWCFYRMLLYKKMLYHERTRGRRKAIDKRAVLGITTKEVQEIMGDLDDRHKQKIDFDPDEWEQRAREANAKIAALGWNRR